MWENENRSGTRFIDESRGSYTWTIGQQTVPQKVYLEAIGGSGSVGDVRLTLAATDAAATQPPRNATTTQASTQPSTSRGLEIRWGNRQLKEVQDIKAGEVIVGDWVSLVAFPLGPNKEGAQYSWTVGGKAIAGYNVGADKGEIVALAGNRLTAKQADFYWLNEMFAGQDTEVSVTASFDNRERTKTTTIEVFRPTAAFKTTVSPPAIVENGSKLTTVATFERTQFDLPQGFAGETSWAQLVNDDIRRRELDGTWKRLKKPAGYGLDGVFPYPMAEAPNTNDSPSWVPDKAIMTAGTRDAKFRMYLMFTSGTPGAIPVPLRIANWGFNAAIHWDAVGNVWKLDEHEPGQIVTPPDADTSDSPTWDFNGGSVIEADEWLPA